MSDHPLTATAAGDRPAAPSAAPGPSGTESTAGSAGDRPAVLRRRLLGLARPVLAPLAWSILCRTIALAAGIALFGLGGWALGGAAAGRAPAWGPLLAGLIGLALLKGLTRYLEQFAGHYVAFKALALLRVHFYDRLEPQAPAGVLGRPTGDLLARVTKDVDRVEVFFAHTLAPVVTAVVVPVATVAVCARWVDPLAGLVLAVGLLAVGLLAPALGSRSSARAAARLRRGRGAVAQHVTDSVQGVREVLAFRYGPRRLAELGRLESDIAAGLTGLGRWIAFRRGFNVTLMAWLIVVQLAVLAARLDLPGQLPMLGLGLGLTLAGFGPVLAVEDFAADLQQAYASARRLFEVTDAEPLVRDPVQPDPSLVDPSRPAPSQLGSAQFDPVQPDPSLVDLARSDQSRLEPIQPDQIQPDQIQPDPTRASRPAGAGQVEFRAVSFAYPPGDEAGSARPEPVLRQVSFTVPGGGVTGLVGASGSGKSTLGWLLTRAWDPDSGAILIDGVDLRQWPLDLLRARVGLIEQRPYLFNDTVVGNLRLAVPEADDRAIASALALSDLTGLVEQSPQGLDTPVGEMGERLSGGQRQRLALARGLLAQPDILVLDEITSQLDRASEERVLAGVAAATRGRTVIAIAHRLSTLRRADWIVVLEAGRVVEQGRFDDLAAQAGVFARLLARQAEGEA
ncbi:MAG: ABC transporter ATP-binding protein/permease [Propionibacteriaceae bacterium]|jgi:ABC-type multidrug transport system fused ATPase/permease subunit|nr:ABC transporter ATP-binding protein/permease [Propionibacteriaceae bacterium]